ncbi:MAG: transcription antitermination factor NusB [Alphaproteobacteria bacterium]
MRRRALEILLAVADGERLDPLLDCAMNDTPDRRAAGFLAELVRGTLQWQGRYDHVITRFSRKRPPTDPVLVGILRLALHQMLGLNGVPAYAAIHQAGELCRLKAGPGKVGFVNGMLQAIRREVLDREAQAGGRQQALRELFAEFASDRPRWLAAWHSLPPWLVTRWAQNFGIEATARLCAWINEPVAVHLHVLGDQSVEDAQRQLAAADLATTVGVGPGTLILNERPGRQELRACLERLPSLVVQDAAVQQATRWLAEDLPPGGSVLDMCAAPGGKTAHLRAFLPPVTSVVAMDNRPERLRLLRETTARVVPGTVPMLMADGQHPPFARGSFGAILLDGPCSGTGVLRHHPDGRWRLQAKTPQIKATTLLELARQATDLLAPGGRLMYATCSLEPEENEQVLATLLAERPDLLPMPDDQDRWQRYWMPHEGQADGFFAARLGKAP